jgi:hypothetical protein
MSDLTEVVLSKLFKKCKEILFYFMSDIRFLDFDNLQIALACLFLSVEMSCGYENQLQLKQMFEEVYNIRISYFQNALFVLRTYVQINYIKILLFFLEYAIQRLKM